MGKSGGNKSLKYALTSIAAVVLTILVVIVVQSPTTTNLNASTTAAPASIVNMLSSVKQSVLDSVGLGSVTSSPKKISGQVLTENNKPEVLYEGAEYCPYCATERWAMAVAFDRFGTFTGLKLTHSSPDDVYPDTQTLSFYGSTYTSPYVAFTPVELYTNVPQGQGYSTLMTPTAQQKSIMDTYDSAPYVPSSDAGAIPFIYFGGKYMISGATYNPSVLQGKTSSQIASSLDTPTNPIAKGADGSANEIVAAICGLTKNQPSSVCNSQIQSYEKALGQ